MKIKISFIGSILLLGAAPAFAHPGGSDASGCHMNHKTDIYHCQ